MKSFQIQPPIRLTIDDERLPDASIFLAGSIEMGAAENWQDEFMARYPNNMMFFNPRRYDWDSSWDHNSPQFDEQVNWELDMLDQSDYIVMYFDPNTKSPISLLELGLYANSGRLIVCCPDGFWRQGNVRIVCERYNIPLFYTKEEWLKDIDFRLRSFIH